MLTWEFFTLWEILNLNEARKPNKIDQKQMELIQEVLYLSPVQISDEFDGFCSNLKESGSNPLPSSLPDREGRVLLDLSS